MTTQGYENRTFLAVIGDEDSITGLLLAGVGHVTDDGEKKKNFVVIDNKSTTDQIEKAFDEYTSVRKDIAVLLINQHVSSLDAARKASHFYFGCYSVDSLASAAA